jgi:tetratricopeptide (TPR) repeat protein
MSKSAELTRKDMKEPDKFQVVAGEAAAWVTARKKQSLIIVLVVAAVVVALVAGLGLSDSKAHSAGAALAEVYRVAGGEISPVPLPGVQGPFFPTDEARQKAVAEAAAKVAAQHAGTHAGALASLALGDAKLRLGEWDAAVTAYDAYLAGAPKGDALRFGALEGLAMAEEGKGSADASLAAWARLGAEVPGYADRADLEKARVLAQAGRREEARKLLAGFAEAHKESILTGEAAERLAKLGGK